MVTRIGNPGRSALSVRRSEVGRRFEDVGDDALLLHEFAHRTANEVAVATAAMHLARRAHPQAMARLMENAAWRLQAFGELNRVLARPVEGAVDAAADLSAVCAAAVAGAEGVKLRMRVDGLLLEGGVARRLVLIAAELVANAVRHAFVGRSGHLDIDLSVEDAAAVLTVADDGPGLNFDAPSSGTGFGSGIVSQLVERGGGTLIVDTGADGTVVRVAFPLAPAWTGPDGAV